MAWGDMNTDGKRDGMVDSLAASGADVRIYPMEGGQPGAEPSIVLKAATAIVDWGDMNGDGYADLAVASADKLQVYRNDLKGGLDQGAAWGSKETGAVSGVSWGDVDNDGDQDLAAAYSDGPTRLYLNSGRQLDNQAAWSSAIDNADPTIAVWADVDGDGDLDLAQVGRTSTGMPVSIYLNRGRPLPAVPGVTSPQKQANSTSAAWGDVDGDGQLELAVGRSGSTPPSGFFSLKGYPPAQSLIYRVRDNALLPDPGMWNPSEAATTSVGWGDIDGDGDLDLAVGNAPAVDRSDPNKLLDTGAIEVYRNSGKGLEPAPAIKLGGPDRPTVAVAWGDIDGDSALDLVAGTHNDSTQVYFNQRTADPAAAFVESDGCGLEFEGKGSNVGYCPGRPEQRRRTRPGRRRVRGQWVDPCLHESEPRFQTVNAIRHRDALRIQHCPGRHGSGRLPRPGGRRQRPAQARLS